MAQFLLPHSVDTILYVRVRKTKGTKLDLSVKSMELAFSPTTVHQQPRNNLHNVCRQTTMPSGAVEH